MTLRELAERLACRLEGDGSIEIRRVAGIEQAGPGDLTFFVNPRYTGALSSTRASAIILADSGPQVSCAALRCTNPYVAFARAIAILHPECRPAPGVHATAVIEPDALVGDDVVIGPYVVIGRGARIGARTMIGAHGIVGAGASLGDDCVLHPSVVVGPAAELGPRVVVQSGAVIGSDGFGFARRDDGSHEKIPQVGRVIIEADCEIGANTAIDRPSVGETRVAAGTKIDNLVQIGHGVRIGREVLLAAQVGIAGSTVIEDRVVLAGQVGVAGHVTLGRGVVATAQSGIPNSVDAGTMVSGYPAIPNREWLKASAIFRRLPELRRTLADLERRLARLEGADRDTDPGASGA